MSASVKNVEILTTLDEDPHVSFFPWEIDVQDVAAGMAKSIHPLGLLSAVLTDEQWAAYPGNAVLDQAGQIQLAPRFTPPVYVDINANMNNAELYVAKAVAQRKTPVMDRLSRMSQTRPIEKLGPSRATSHQT
jgi:hypothetical protein